MKLTAICFLPHFIIKLQQFYLINDPVMNYDGTMAALTRHVTARGSMVFLNQCIILGACLV